MEALAKNKTVPEQTASKFTVSVVQFKIRLESKVLKLDIKSAFVF